MRTVRAGMLFPETEYVKIEATEWDKNLLLDGW
jgi:hypothetical protein